MKKMIWSILFAILPLHIYATLSFDQVNTWRMPLKAGALSKNLSCIPLFESFSVLRDKVPYMALGKFPTPIVKLEKIGKKLGCANLYLKNDGVSIEPFGGNKIRKLEFLLADALENDVESVITVGDAGSNHALATIICAQKLGLKTYSMLAPQLNTSYLRRNLLLSLYYDGIIHYYDSAEERDNGVFQLCVDLKNREGKFPYFIPSGGSCPLGVLGFVNAVFELKKQTEQGLMPEPDFIYVAMGSAGTAAGIILGLRLAGMQSKVIPVRVSGDAEEKEKVLLELLGKTNRFLHGFSPKDFPLMSFQNDEVLINHDFAGNQYAQVTQEAAAAIKDLFDMEGIRLEGTYTGKACAAMMNDLKNNDSLRNKVVLFWDTFCAEPCSSIINNVDYTKLPVGLHCYFEEPLQVLDQDL